MDKTTRTIVHVPCFSRALATYVAELPAGTYWRYAHGHIPAFGRFLLKHPDLAKAFAADAVALSQMNGATDIIKRHDSERYPLPYHDTHDREGRDYTG
jgi:hypothetical protein